MFSCGEVESMMSNGEWLSGKENDEPFSKRLTFVGLKEKEYTVHSFHHQIIIIRNTKWYSSGFWLVNGILPVFAKKWIADKYGNTWCNY